MEGSYWIWVIGLLARLWSCFILFIHSSTEKAGKENAGYAGCPGGWRQH